MVPYKMLSWTDNWKKESNVIFNNFTSFVVYFQKEVSYNNIYYKVTSLTVNIFQTYFEYVLGKEKEAILYLSTVQKMKFSIKDFFSKFDQIHRKLPIWSHLLKKSLMVNFIFCTVFIIYFQNEASYTTIS